MIGQRNIHAVLFSNPIPVKTCWLISAALVVFLCAGCTTFNQRAGSVIGAKTNVKMQIVAAGNINPDESSVPSPVFIRLYELENNIAFEKADFIEIYEQDDKILAADLIAKQELKRFTPGEARKTHFVLNEKTRYIGLFAEFFRYKDAKYKLIFPVTATNLVANSVKIEIQGNKILLLTK